MLGSRRGGDSLIPDDLLPLINWLNVYIMLIFGDRESGAVFLGSAVMGAGLRAVGVGEGEPASLCGARWGPCRPPDVARGLNGGRTFQSAGISRSSLHKRRATGGRQPAWRKGKKYELGRQSGNCKLSSNVTVRTVRVRGGNKKFRALRLDSGNFSWGSEACTRRTRVLDVVYNASNNELVRTKTLVKNAIVAIDAAPFKQYYSQVRPGARTGRVISGRGRD